MNILLAAEESAGMRLLAELHRSSHRIVAVLANDDSRSVGASVWTRAKALGLRTLPARLLKSPETIELFRYERIDLLLNVHSLFVVHPALLALPRLGAFNLHPGPLPRYAGLNAPSWALYHGETTHAVTLHRMAAGIDTGPIVFEQQFPVSDRDTGLSVAVRCAAEGVPLVLRLLEVASQRPEDIPSRAQDLRHRRYFGRQVPQGGRIDWNRTAEQVFNFVRACDYGPYPSPWGQPAATLGGRPVLITKVGLTGLACDESPGTVRSSDPGRTLVACADEWIELLRVSIHGTAREPHEFLSHSRTPQFV
jgi:methionyl-tRNA formyltransferase